MGNPAGNEALAMELVGFELASALGLLVPAFAVVNLAGIPVVTIKDTPLHFGPAFISKAIRGSTGDPSGVFLQKLSNPKDVAKLIALDTWIRNFDRCPPADYLDPTPKWDNLFFSPARGRFKLVDIDHTHAFVEEGLDDGLQGAQFVDDNRVFGAFDQFLPFVDERRLRNAAAQIRAIDAGTIEQIVASIPLPWGPSRATRDRWSQALFARGRQVEGYLIDGLVPQQQLAV